MTTNRTRGVLLSLGLLLATGALVLTVGCSGGSSSTPPAPTVSSILAAPSTMALSVAGTSQITVTANMSDASTSNVTATATYSTSAAGVATVSAGGLVTAVAPGTATITATYSGKTSTVAVTVAPTLSSITVAPATSALVVAGTAQIVVTSHMSDSTTATVTSGSTFASSATGVATVSTGGLITAVAPGTATITTTYQTKTATTTVTVSAAVTLSSITVAPTTLALNPAGTGQIVVTANMSDSTTSTVTSSATFSSSASGVATVSTGGLVTAVAAGTATITATYQTKTATVAVTVTALPVVKYVYSTASSTADIAAAWGEWGTGTTQTIYAADATYNPCLKLVSGTGWGPAFCQAWSSLDQGKLSEFTTLKFKIKTSDYAAVSVKIPSTGANEELSYALSTGTALSGGWIQMSVPLSDFLTNPVGGTEFAIFGFGAGTVYLTDIGFTGTAAVNKTGLAAAVSSAQALLALHTVGAGDGNVTQAVHDAYNTAINTAYTVVTGSPTAQSTVTAAWVALNSATATFNAAIIHLVPTTLPSTPALAASAVIALHTSSGTYTPISGITWNPGWGQASTLVDATVATKTVKLLTMASNGSAIYQGVDFAGNAQNISTKSKLHLDYWTGNGQDLSITVITGGTEVPISIGSVTKGGWTSVDVNFSAVSGISSIIQLKFTANTAGIFYLDNIYFH